MLGSRFGFVLLTAYRIERMNAHVSYLDGFLNLGRSGTFWSV